MSEKQLNTFTMEDGLKVDYYLDEEGFPYNEIDGERVYMALPLSHLLITDKAALELYNINSPEDPAIGNSLPTDYVDLSGGNNTYSQTASLPDDSAVYTKIFKWNPNHVAAKFTTSDIRSTNGKRISLAYGCYLLSEGRWKHTLLKMGFDFSAGFKFLNFPNTQPYGQFYFNKHDNVYSFTYTVLSSATLGNIEKDAMVVETQQWLNRTYTDKYGGTDWVTINALNRALQIEMGIAQPEDNFGDKATAKFISLYPTGIHQQADGDSHTSNVYAIIQGALWCKGYSTGSKNITMNFYGETGNAVKELKTDAGMVDPDSTVTLEVVRALLSMKQYKTNYKLGGTEIIRSIQQRFNRDYMAYVGLVPCDGLYTGEMNEALITVLQAIEGYSVENATGSFGDETKDRLPILNSSSTNSEAIFLARAALCCNGYVNPISSPWDVYFEEILRGFQIDMRLSDTKTVDTNTWCALFISSGNIDRPSNGCTTHFEITSPRLNILKSHDYEVVGRYLTGGDSKELRVGEVERILAGGMKMFPIFQESGADISYFTPARGRQDAITSANAARKYGMPKDTIIYFAVDSDPLDYEIQDLILPYFKALSENFDPNYQIGIYGTRNACTQVCNNLYAVTSFVADMSYGASGNMGFKIPSNWNFDQYYKIDTSESGWDFDLDKTTYSARFPVVDHVEHRDVYQQPQIPSAPSVSILTFINDIYEIESMFKEWYDRIIAPVPGQMPLLPDTLVMGVTRFLRSQEYDEWLWYFTTGNSPNYDFVDYVKENRKDIWDHLYDYIKEEVNSETNEVKRWTMSDGESGSIDLSHMAASIEGYIGFGLIPNIMPGFWSSWGGDLATGMDNTTVNYENRNNPGYEMYAGKTLQQIADATIGKEILACNYTDFCCDFDAYRMSKYLEVEFAKNEDEWSFHLLSEALTWYYQTSGAFRSRFTWIGDELNCPLEIGNLDSKIHTAMNGDLERLKPFGLLAMMAGNSTDEVNQACCNSFANYIYAMQPLN